MKKEVCPCCKRTFAPEIKVGGKRRQAALDYITKHPEGVTSEQIITFVYSDDPDGGPNNPNIVAAMVACINKVIRQHGYEIRSSRGPGATYSLIEIEPRALKEAA